MGKYSAIFFILFTCINKFSAQNKRADSILTSFIKQKTAPASFTKDTTMVRTLGELCWELRIGGNYKYALLYADSALKILGRCLKGAAGAAQKNAVERKILSITNYSALVYSNSGNYPEAVKTYYGMLKKAEAINDSDILSVAYNNLGNVYQAMKNDSEALKCFNRSMLIMKQTGNKSYGRIYSNLGIIYTKQKNFIKAEECFTEALKFCLAEGYKPWISGAYTNLGDFYYHTGKRDKALENFLLSLRIKKESGAKGSMPTVLNNIASIYLSQKKYKESFTCLNQALSIGLEVGKKEVISASYESLARAYTETGNYKAAYNNYKLYIAYRDSLNNDEFTKKTIRSRMQYDFDKKETADSIKNTEAKKFEEIKHQQEISRQKTFTYGGIAGFLVMIIVAGISYNAFRNKKKTNIEIQRQKHLVEEKQKEILDSIYYARRIQRSLLTSEKYFERNLNRLIQT